MLNYLQFRYNLWYNCYFNPYEINLYNVINKLTKMKSIGINYFGKYPTAKNWINMNEELFAKVPEAKKEYLQGQHQQDYIVRQVIDDIRIICDKCVTKDYEICNAHFQSYFIQRSYHLEQYPDEVINIVTRDICNHKDKT